MSNYMTGQKEVRKANVPFLAGVALLCLTLVSMHLSSGLYARYSASSDVNGSANVAAFKVTIDEKSITGAPFEEELLLDIAPGDTSYALSIDNSSEVAIECTVTVSNATGNIPLAFSVDHGATSARSCTASFDMAVDEKGRECPVTISWDPSDALEYMGMVDLIKVTVEVEQID